MPRRGFNAPPNPLPPDRRIDVSELEEMVRKQEGSSAPEPPEHPDEQSDAETIDLSKDYLRESLVDPPRAARIAELRDRLKTLEKQAANPAAVHRKYDEIEKDALTAEAQLRELESFGQTKSVPFEDIFTAPEVEEFITPLEGTRKEWSAKLRSLIGKFKRTSLEEAEPTIEPFDPGFTTEGLKPIPKKENETIAEQMHREERDRLIALSQKPEKSEAERLYEEAEEEQKKKVKPQNNIIQLAARREEKAAKEKKSASKLAAMVGTAAFAAGIAASEAPKLPDRPAAVTTEQVSPKSPEASSAAASEISLSAEAKLGEGAEFIVKRLKYKMQGLNPNNYPDGSDVRVLKSATDKEVNGLVHRLALKHGWYKDGHSMIIRPHTKVSYDAQGQLTLTNVLERSKPEAPIAASAPEEPIAAAAPVVTPEAATIDQPGVPPFAAPPAPEQPAPMIADEGPQAIENSVPTSEGDLYITKHFGVSPKEAHIFSSDEKGEHLFVYGGEKGQKYEILEKYFQAHPDAVVYELDVTADMHRTPMRSGWFRNPKDGRPAMGPWTPTARILPGWQKVSGPKGFKKLIA